MIHDKLIKLNICITALFVLLLVFCCSASVQAFSVPTASGRINSYDGAILRRSSSVSSDILDVLADNTKLTIHMEIFKSKTSTDPTKKWYYVTANGKKGYVRSDLVDTIKYRTVKGETTSMLNYRKGAGTKMKALGTYAEGASLTIVLKAMPVGSSKGSAVIWYKIRVGEKYYYVCSDKVKLGETKNDGTDGASESADRGSYVDEPATEMNDQEFDDYLRDQGFPESYRKKLRKLHNVHPDWGFVAYYTGMDWSAALARQTKGGTSLVSGYYGSKYRDGSKQYEKGWYKAKRSVVAYYMDPRNFLNEDSVYMFEDLSYKPSYQKRSVVRAILSPTRLPGYGFTAKIFVSAGSANNVSPVFLASRARQETGGGSDAINGTKVLGKKVYNPFNIGAFGSNPLYNGLLYAYRKGWTSPKKSVEGGSLVLAKNYINQGQFTMYYQRFNVRNGASKVGTHQYMTNIMAPYSESLSTRDSYVKYGITSNPIVFEIPVYSRMPAKTRLP